MKFISNLFRTEWGHCDSVAVLSSSTMTQENSWTSHFRKIPTLTAAWLSSKPTHHGPEKWPLCLKIIVSQQPQNLLYKVTLRPPQTFASVLLPVTGNSSCGAGYSCDSIAMDATVFGDFFCIIHYVTLHGSRY